MWLGRNFLGKIQVNYEKKAKIWENEEKLIKFGYINNLVSNNFIILNSFI